MKKTFLCFSLSFALLASALSPSFSADVFAKAKLAKTKITLTVGQKKKITIKGKKKKAKYTFKASNKKVSVNKKGVVTAKKAGKTKITVKEKLKKKTKKIGVVTIIIKSKVSNKKSIASAQPAAKFRKYRRKTNDCTNSISHTNTAPYSNRLSEAYCHPASKRKSGLF